MGDAESDVWEALVACRSNGCGFITRACQDRRLEGLALGYRGMVEFFDRTFEAAEETLRAALAVAVDGCDEVRLLASAWLTVLYLTMSRIAGP